MHSLKIKHLTDATYLLTIAFAVIIDTNVSVHAENISLSYSNLSAGQSIKQFLSNQSFSLSLEREKSLIRCPNRVQGDRVTLIFGATETTTAKKFKRQFLTGNQCDPRRDKKVAQLFSKVAKIISTAYFTLIDRFQNSPKISNLFRLLFRANLLPRTCQKSPNLVTLPAATNTTAYIFFLRRARDLEIACARLIVSQEVKSKGKAAAVDPFARRVDSLKTNYNCNSTFFADSVTVKVPFYK